MENKGYYFNRKTRPSEPLVGTEPEDALGGRPWGDSVKMASELTSELRQVAYEVALRLVGRTVALGGMAPVEIEVVAEGVSHFQTSMTGSERF